MLQLFSRRLSLAAGAAVALGLFAQPVLTAAHPAMDIVVKNWSFTPNSVETHVGEPTVLRFTSSEGVHGVESEEIGLAKTTIMPGKVTEASFTPKTEGTFAVHCAIVCGEGHEKMILTVKVSK